MINLSEFFENLVECLGRAAEVYGVAVLASNVAAQLLVQFGRVFEVPLYRAHHWTNGLVSGQVLQVVRPIPILRVDKWLSIGLIIMHCRLLILRSLPSIEAAIEISASSYYAYTKNSALWRTRVSWNQRLSVLVLQTHYLHLHLGLLVQTGMQIIIEWTGQRQNMDRTARKWTHAYSGHRECGQNELWLHIIIK